MNRLFQYLIFLSCAIAPFYAHGKPLSALLKSHADADKVVELQGKHWLLLDKQGLHLFNSQHEAVANKPLQSELLDTRQHVNGALALVLDEGTQQPRVLVVDTKQNRITVRHQLPTPKFEINAMCLYRDAQQYDYAFLIGEEGQGEQWLLSGARPRLYRTLSLPAGVMQCQVDDASHTLFVGEGNMGVWAYDIEGESTAERKVIALKRPYGKLLGEPSAFALLPNGLVIKDKHKRRILVMRNKKGSWVVGKKLWLKRQPDGDALFVLKNGKGFSVRYRDKEQGRWHSKRFNWKSVVSTQEKLPFVKAVVQTKVVNTAGDSADDPAIWVHPSDASKSVVLGTNKKHGLFVYDMKGNEMQAIPVGRINNVDLRQGVQFAGRKADVAVATNRDANAFDIFEIGANGKIKHAVSVPTGLKEIYGMCLYQPPAGGLEMLANDKDGSFEQYRLVQDGKTYGGKLLRKFAFASQVEGCVVDDRSGRLFVGEEKRGVWAMSSSDYKQAPRLIMAAGKRLKADVEGLAIYHGQDARYLVVSSQGNDSYVVLDAEAPHRYRGAFRVGANAEMGIDGTSETDGIEVTSQNLGGIFSKGMMVIQDGHKRMPDDAQNFKYVPWSDIEKALELR